MKSPFLPATILFSLCGTVNALPLLEFFSNKFQFAGEATCKGKMVVGLLK